VSVSAHAPETAALRRYLQTVLGRPVDRVTVSPLGGGPPAEDLKGFGYGTPLRIDCAVGGAPRRFVLARQRAQPGYGHDYPSDRAQAVLWNHDAYNTLPRHVASRDVGFLLASGALVSVTGWRDAFDLVDFVEGTEYRRDLERIAAEGVLAPGDIDRVDALAAYLAGIHGERRDAPQLYHRRIRELVGHGECIMGVLDGYPHPFPLLPPGDCEAIERAAVGWRWRLRDRVHRLATVHGDFHPWNILFRTGTDFTLLDRSRGEWGEPADDVAALVVNYLFFALVAERRFHGPLRVCFERFFERYLAGTGDSEILEVLPPFLLFRGLVLASPKWYPTLDEGIRRALLRLVWRMTEPGPFDPAAVEAYLEPQR
jgi:hypothetical protein